MTNTSRLILSAAFTTILSTGLVASASADTFNTQRCVNMGNALDAPNEGDWGHVIDTRNFAKIKAAGFDTVRIPVRWSAHTGSAPAYRIDPRFAARVDEVINAATAAGLQVIVNVHHFEELNSDPDGHAVKFLTLWQQIAARYANQPSSVYFEIVNEPNENFKGDQMRAVMTAAVQEIRKMNPTRIVILGGEEWNSLESLPTIPQIDDPNQVYTFHYYSPFEFTHQKASWTHLKNSGTVTFGSREDYKALDKAMDYAAKVRRETGKQIFVGEFGAYDKAPYEDTVKYYEATRKAMEKRGLSWCAWSFTATFPLYDSDSGQWDRAKLAALGLAPNIAGNTSSPARAPRARKTSGSQFQGQTLDQGFNNLRRALPKDGQLMNRPFAEEIGFYGKAKTKVVSDSGVPGGKAMEIKTSKERNPWDSAASAPVTMPIKKGDVIAMSFYAKTIKGEGILSQAGLQLNREPYTSIMAEKISLSPTWQQYFVTGRASQDYKAGEAAYTIHVSGTKQTLRMGPLFILNLGPNADMSLMPTNP